MRDRYGASREELLRVVVQQHEQIAALERTMAHTQQANVTLTTQVTALTLRVTALLAALDAVTGGDDPGSGTPKGMPGHKASAPPPRPAKPRKRRTHSFSAFPHDAHRTGHPRA